MRNRIALTSLYLLLGLTISAQNGSKWKIGVKAGVNYTDQQVSNFPDLISQDLNKLYNESTGWIPGLNAGLHSQLQLTEKINLNVDLAFNQKGYNGRVKDTNSLEVKYTNRFYYISLPIYGGLQLTRGLAVEIGAESSYFLGLRGKYGDTKIERGNNDALSNFDFGIIGGLSLRLNDRLSVQGRYYRGLVDVLEAAFTDINGVELEQQPKHINHGLQLSLTVFPF